MPAPPGITGGSIELVGARPGDMLAITNALAQTGLIVEFCDKGDQGQRQRQAQAARSDDRAVPRLSRPTCRRNSWRC